MAQSHVPPVQERRPEAALSLALRGVGAFFIAFFVFAFVGSVTEMTEPRFLYRMLGWGGPGDPEEQMMSAIYVVWGGWLWAAARSPERHRLFVDFTIAANAAHGAVMFVQAVALHDEHGHLHGDVLLWILVVVVLAVPRAMTRSSRFHDDQRSMEQAEV